MFGVVGHVDGEAGEFVGEGCVLAGEVLDGVAEVVVGVLEGAEFAGLGVQVLEEDFFHLEVVKLALFSPGFEEYDDGVLTLDCVLECLDLGILCGRHMKR